MEYDYDIYIYRYIDRYDMYNSNILGTSSIIYIIYINPNNEATGIRKTPAKKKKTTWVPGSHESHVKTLPAMVHFPGNEHQ